MVILAREWMVAQREDADAFERLFLEHYPRVVGIAYRVLRDEHAAEDVAQDVFYDFQRKHDAGAVYASAWLYRAAVHSALNLVRSTQRRRRREAAEVSGRHPLEVQAQNASDPQVAAEVAERRQEVRTALAHLPKKQASVLVMRHSGLTYAEIAEALGVRVGQIGTILRRAEAAFKKEMLNETR